MTGRCSIAWWGHATASIAMDGARVLTDPVVTPRAGHLARMAPPPPEERAPCDAVLISHLHIDHLHLRSLRRIEARRVIGPPGLAGLLPPARRDAVREVEPGQSVPVGPLTVTAVPAEHDGRRTPWSRARPALGFLITGSRTVYFAGDTGPFAGMEALGDAGIDAALLPIWGWGPTLGRGHLDPLTAAQALTLLRPRAAVPIHWGTYAPLWVSRRRPPEFLTRPVQEFVDHAGRLAPAVRVAALRPGGPGLGVP